MNVCSMFDLVWMKSTMRIVLPEVILYYMGDKVVPKALSEARKVLGQEEFGFRRSHVIGTEVGSDDSVIRDIQSAK